MRTAAVFFLIFGFLFGSGQTAGDPSGYLPADREIGEWAKQDKPEHYTRDSLFGYINGGAEIFLEYSFEELWLARYGDDRGSEITLEIYRMKTEEDAFGIFSVKRSGDEQTLSGIPGPHWITETQANLIKGPYFVNITAFDCPAGELEAFAVFLEGKIKGRFAELPQLALFPKPRRVPDSGRFIRGQLAAVAESILFERDFWGFKRGTVAYSSRYAPSSSRAVVLYFPEKVGKLQEKTKELFAEFLDDVKSEGEIISGKNAVGNFFLFQTAGNRAVLILGEGDPEFARSLLDQLSDIH